jgi:hypothetical protein
MTIQCATVSLIQLVQILTLSSFWNASYDTVPLPKRENNLSSESKIDIDSR